MKKHPAQGNPFGKAGNGFPDFICTLPSSNRVVWGTAAGKQDRESTRTGERRGGLPCSSAIPTCGGEGQPVLSGSTPSLRFRRLVVGRTGSRATGWESVEGKSRSWDGNRRPPGPRLRRCCRRPRSLGAKTVILGFHRGGRPVLRRAMTEGRNGWYRRGRGTSAGHGTSRRFRLEAPLDQRTGLRGTSRGPLRTGSPDRRRTAARPRRAGTTSGLTASECPRSHGSRPGTAFMSPGAARSRAGTADLAAGAGHDSGSPWWGSATTVSRTGVP